MKKKYAFYLVFFMFNFINSQTNKSNLIYVEYKSSIYENSKTTSTKIISEDVKRGAEEYTKAIEKIEYGLFVNDSISIFKKIDKLESNNTNNLANILGGGIYYVDTSLKEKIKQIETLGEVFNINYPYDEYKWEISTETRIINGYKCYKATSHKETYTKLRKKTLIVNPVVWFSPDIPINFGPMGLCGLPGLILEASLNQKTYYYATLINFNYTNSEIEIEKPKKGKYVSEGEMEDIQMKAMFGN